MVNSKDLTIQKKIGSGGGNAAVFKALYASKEVAYKVFHIDESQEGEKFKVFEKEVELLSSLRHPHILEFYGATIEDNRVGYLMPLCVNGDLKAFLSSLKEKGTEYPFDKKIKMLVDVGSALAYLHSKRVIHRDLKPENVLVDGNEIVKLMDFGLGKIVNDDEKTKTKTMRVGTSIYMAPEVVNGGHYNEKVDCFSFGMMIYVALSEKWDPYEIKGFGLEALVANDENFRPNLKELDSRFSVALKDLIQRLWKSNSKERPTIHEAMKAMKLILEDSAGEGFISVDELKDELLKHIDLKKSKKSKELIERLQSTLQQIKLL